MKFHVLTLFPEMIEQGLNPSIIGRAAEKNLIWLHPVNIRDYTLDKHGKVDDYPYGGGAGMLLRAQPVYDAHKAVSGGRPLRTVYVTPQGRPFDQKLAKELAKEEEIILLCGHYEGIDERVLEEVVTDYVSIGDYIITGGELAAMVIIDAVSRLIPGVLGNDSSAEEESFYNDLLEYPQYSRPEVWQGKSVPKILLSGNHREVQKWRLEQSKGRTARMRPDLYEKYQAKQHLIGQLSKDKRNNIHLIELLSRGLGEILYAKEGDVLLYQKEGQTCMLRAKNHESAEQLLKYCPQETALYVTSQAFLKDLLEQKKYHTFLTCRQFVYTQKEALPVRYKDIRQLDMDSFDYICAHYNIGDSRYVRDRLQSGTMYGAYVDGQLSGFIGTHSEGSLGMLYVSESHRRRSLAQSLVAYAANRMLERGWIPYGQVEAANSASIHLQEKLGFYQAKDTIWWLKKA